MILFVKATKTASLIIFTTGGCVIYLTQNFYKVPKNIRDNCSHFCILNFHPRENKRIADELGVDRDILGRATDEDYSFFYYDKRRKLMKKILTKIYNGVYQQPNRWN